MTIFFEGVQHVLCSVYAFCIQSYTKSKQKNLNNVSNAKYDKTSIWFATLAISIVDDWAPDTIKIRLPRLIIAPHGSNFATNFCPYYQSAEKTGRCREFIMEVGDTSYWPLLL